MTRFGPSGTVETSHDAVQAQGRDCRPTQKHDVTAAISPATTELGRRLRAIRQRYIDNGGKLLSMDEIDRELADRRGERYPTE